MAVSFEAFDQLFPDEAACLTHVAQARFGRDLVCPHCGREQLLRSVTRPKRLGCLGCRRDISIGKGTVFDHCRGSFRDLLYLMLILANSTSIVSTSFVERHFGVSRMAAYRMLMMARAHFAGLNACALRGGAGKQVHIDETWCASVRHADSGGRQGVIVFGIIDADGVNAQVIPSRRRAEILPIILSSVRAGSVVITDQHATYASLGNHGFRHIALNHSRAQWADGQGASSAMIESYWTSLKYFLRFANGAIYSTQFTLYLAEHVFKFNAARTGQCAFAKMISQFPEIERGLLPQAVDYARYRRLRAIRENGGSGGLRKH